MNVVEGGLLGSWDWAAVPNLPNCRGVTFRLEDPGPSVDGWWRELGNPAATRTPTPTSTPVSPGPIPGIEFSEIGMAGFPCLRDAVFGHQLFLNFVLNLIFYLSAGRTRVVKQEPTEIIEDVPTDVAADISPAIPCRNANLSSNGEPDVIVKSEPIDLFDSSPEPVANVSCMVQANSESFLVSSNF